MTPHHTEHCRPCKERLFELLTVVYGECLMGHSFPWPARPEEYRGTPISAALEEIQAQLERFRGYRSFIKADRVPPSDFYVPRPGFILEFDESQHFTRARFITLSFYRPHLKVGFPVQRWQELCGLINARDDDPPDRDERRAWYDTLRDLVPILQGLRPTVRIHSEEARWCMLDGRSRGDQQGFLSILKGRLPAAEG